LSRNRADEIARLIERNALTEDTLGRLAKQVGWSDLSIKTVLQKLDILSIDETVASGPLSYRVLARRFVAITLFTSSIFFIFGGILTGKSEIFADRPWLAIFCLLALLAILALFEGLQICVALLRLKDVDSLRISHPNTVELHRFFRSEEGTRRFLAGRQFFVVFVVFFIARITSFPEMRVVPFLDLTLPSRFEWLWYPLFDLGLLGAFLVLWVGQLAPQFAANRNPQGFLDKPGMGLALRSSFVVDNLGITLPGLWLADRTPRAEPIPPSRMERFRISSEAGSGLAVLMSRRRITSSNPKTVTEYHKHYLLARGGFDSMSDESLLIGSSEIEDTSFNVQLHRDAVEEATAFEVTSSRVHSEATLYSFRVSPKVGGFVKGDLLGIHASVHCRSCTSHRVEVTEPTRILHLIFEFDEGHFVRVGAIQVKRSDIDSRLAESHSLEFSKDGKHHVAEYFALFVHPGEVIDVSWTVV
jgi:hypothetical protein